MGEAKRRNQLGRQSANALQGRIDAGEFGAAGRDYLIVLDKSARAREALLALRTRPVLDGLAALLDGDALRVWQASTLFAYAVLCGGAGAPDARVLLATDRDRLVRRTLPQAAQRCALEGRWPGVLIEVDETDRSEVLRCIEGLRGQVMHGA